MSDSGAEKGGGIKCPGFCNDRKKERRRMGRRRRGWILYAGLYPWIDVDEGESWVGQPVGGGDDADVRFRVFINYLC